MKLLGNASGNYHLLLISQAIKTVCKKNKLDNEGQQFARQLTIEKAIKEYLQL